MYQCNKWIVIMRLLGTLQQYNPLIMENERFRKKVYMQTEQSTLINPKLQVIPRWVCQSRVIFPSAYELCSYSIQSQRKWMIQRDVSQGQILLTDYKQDQNESHNEMYYLYQNNSCFFLVHHKFKQSTRILIHKREIEHKSVIVQKFLDYIIKNQDQPQFSNPSLINKTQQLIDSIREDDQQRGDFKYDITGVKDLKVVYQCNFALMLVEMGKINGVMLVNINKATQENYKEFKCSMMDLDRCEPELNQEDALSSKLIYLFPEPLIEIHGTKDITQFVFLTRNNLLLIKINYQLMELCLISKYKINQQIYRIISLHINNVQGEVYIVALAQAKKEVSIHNLKCASKSFLKLFKVQEKRIIEIQSKNHYRNCLRYKSKQQKTLKFLDQQSEKAIELKQQRASQSQYQISQQQIQQFNMNKNMIMNVFSSMLNEQGHTQEKIEFQREIQKKKTHYKDKRDKIIANHSNNRSRNVINSIGGVVSNKNIVVIWEKDESVLHVCKIITVKQLQQRYQREKQESMVKPTNKIIVKQKQIKEMYAQLMGNHQPHKEQNTIIFKSRIEYLKKIELQASKIHGLSLSPNNQNMLIVTSNGMQSKESYSYSIFQLQLFLQLSNPDPTMFIKPIKSIHRSKATEYIAVSLVKETPLFLSGNLIHSPQAELLQGVISFDIHPYHLFVAVSFGFSAKIYALEGNERLSSLHTTNLQGIKQVKYSHMGNHLCLMSSKSIKIMDSYSFVLKFSINQKNSTLSRCFFSSNTLEFFTITDNHHISIYNTFDYSRMDLIRPTHPEYRPLSLRPYPKEMQYCIVLQNGSLLVKYKPQAIVVNHEAIYRYLDNERINCVEIDQKNGILFTGCLSGKLRAHIWPLKEDMNFQNYNEIRISFTPILSMALSNLHHNLYIGNANGNTSKIKFIIDRSTHSSQHSSPSQSSRFAFTQNNLNYITMNSNHCLQKVYRFVLANGSSINEQLPQKARLQYKLSEVIGKLNEEMHKLKYQIKDQIEEKTKMAKSKFDVNLFHHLNKIITTKLATNYQDELDSNHREIEELKVNHHEELTKILKEQNQLIKQKSFIISSNVAERNRIKQSYTQQLNTFIAQQQKQLQKISDQLQFNQRKSWQQWQQLQHLPNSAYDYNQQRMGVLAQLQQQNRCYYQLRKQVAYKQTAIREMNSKKVKQQSLQLKLDIQTNQMNKKKHYNQNVIHNLKAQMEDAEQKVHHMQMQATVIKNSAQFKKIVKVDQMNDACSYKLWIKDRTEDQIEELSAHLKLIQDCLQNKSTEMVDLIFDKNQKQQQIASLQQQLSFLREKLKTSKLNLLHAKNRVRVHDPHRQYFKLLSGNLLSRQRKGQLSLQKLNSTRNPVNKDVSLFNSIMQKQMNFLKTTIKIHKRKVDNYGKQNGQLLTQFEKLKYENKALKEQAQVKVRTIKNEMRNYQSVNCSPSKENINVQLGKTSFQRYIQSKSRDSSKFKTATNTPSRINTSRYFD